MEDKTDLHQYQWIINEGLLRDEGVLFGLAGAAIGDKIDAIREYYRIKKAGAQTKREQLEKEIAEVGADLARQLAEAQALEPGKVNLVPVLIQLFLYGGICYFNFFLETYWLSPVIRSIPICVGLYLFGLFSVFLGRSIMYNSVRDLADGRKDGQPREKWKIYLEELAVPLVVSLFVAVLPSFTYPLTFSILAALFFFLLFLLGGKGLVNNFFRLRVEAGRHFQRYGEKRRQKKWAVKLRTLRGEQSVAMAALMELDGEEEYKIHILTSEYKLAIENRQLANQMSLKN